MCVEHDWARSTLLCRQYFSCNISSNFRNTFFAAAISKILTFFHCSFICSFIQWIDIYLPEKYSSLFAALWANDIKNGWNEGAYGWNLGQHHVFHFPILSSEKMYSPRNYECSFRLSPTIESTAMCTASDKSIWIFPLNVLYWVEFLRNRARMQKAIRFNLSLNFMAYIGTRVKCMIDDIRNS